MDLGTFGYENVIPEIKKLLKKEVSIIIVPTYDCTPGNKSELLGYRVGTIEVGDN